MKKAPKDTPKKKPADSKSTKKQQLVAPPNKYGGIPDRDLKKNLGC